MEQKENYFKQWSDKLSIPVEEIEKEFQIVKGRISNEIPESSEDEKEVLALKRLAISYKKQLRSPAVGFNGIILGAEDTRDIVAKQRKDALDFFSENPQLAISQGVVNENGTPLDTRKEWSTGKLNIGFGKPLPEHLFMRKIFGVAYKTNEEPKFFTMSINGDVCNTTIPLMKPVRFMGIDKSQDDIVYTLNSSSFTTFDIDEKTECPDIKELIEKYLDVAKISELEDYHKQNKEDYNRVVAVEATVSSLNLEPTAFGSRIMNIEDGDDIMNLESKGITCWISKDINIDFAEGSKVYIIGKTSQGKLKDEIGNVTDEDGDITINVMSVYPTVKIQRPDIDLIKEI